MALSEFSLIERYFTALTAKRDDVALGIGDDCALLCCPPGHEVAVSIDTLVEGVHFFADVEPKSLGHKCLAVGLSDLAAMGASPAWFTLALTLPGVDESWLAGFAAGMAALAGQHDMQLVGGDTTRGPLTISIQVHGLVEAGQALRRDGAQAGDRIYVSGTLGDAGAALKIRLENWQPSGLEQADRAYFQQRLERPEPRNELGMTLRALATAAIDISDGLMADLGHILERSHKGAVIDVDSLPLSPALQKLDGQTARQLALSSGDDYELCFTLPASKAAALDAVGLELTCIGEITEQTGLRLESAGRTVSPTYLKAGYDHFSA